MRLVSIAEVVWGALTLLIVLYVILAAQGADWFWFIDGIGVAVGVSNMAAAAKARRERGRP